MTRFSTKGFTIVETLVAIAVLVAAVIGAMSAIQTGISSYTYSKDQIIAFYLAQEGFEQLRNIRDENNLEERHWLAGIAESSSDPCFFGEACTVSPVETTVAINCSAPGSCPLLRQDPVEDFFGYDAAWPETVFRREITLESVNSNEVSVTVTVTWSKGTAVREFTARENLLNWPPGTLTP